ncbi:WD repeat protein [Cordyceps militaris CM01]|uniref:WD repeat protein n=2 Tax=Cordyceps militaris TaxID=73501 RepID=G3JMB7_CORMM|nr:WD repeat protein [Cordyceps militaris CM01]ATY62656.1 WD repeat [Cordyceps militaris]EGX90005.1 WD repeat protein [Cordyceps militaris CM01]
MASHGDENPAPEQTSANEQNESGSEGGNTLYYSIQDEMDDDDDEDYEDAPDELEADDFQDDPRTVEFQVIFGNDDDEEIDIDDQSDDADDDEDEDYDEEEAQHINPDERREEAFRILSLLRARHQNGLISRGQLLALLSNRHIGRGLMGDNGEVELELEGFFGPWGTRSRRPPKDPNRFPKVPSDEGRKLMQSGTFGSSNETIRQDGTKRIARRMLERELGIGDRRQRTRNTDLIAQSLVPSTRVEQIIHYDDPIYSGQFSDDGNFFFSVCQDFKVRMYDTSNPYRWQHYKTVSFPGGQWTLTDASLSPDNKWLAYTSIDSWVCIAPTDPSDRGDPYALNLAEGTRRVTDGFRRRGFGIWSIRFSGDGRELVAGTNAHSLVIYDIESRQVLHHVEGHEDDVNAVCFADKLSPHILYSGSDDATIKVWDRRSMGDGREVGAFVGHVEGLTYIDSKGDGRYILSNGKDQSMKLWDLRMAMSTERFHDMGRTRYAHSTGFDYRNEMYDESDWDAHPHDNSLVTFRGHKVLRTLIRCHFSPPSATNSRYVYSGSADGKVYVYNMDATIARIIDVKQATAGTRRRDRRTRLYFDEPGGWGTCVRDASWNPNAPVIVASAWNGYSMARGTCTVHSFNEADEDEGEPEMGQSVDDMLKDNPDFYPSNY